MVFSCTARCCLRCGTARCRDAWVMGCVSMQLDRFCLGHRAVGRSSLLALALIGALVLPPASAQAETVKNPIAVFAALDKVTGRISHLEIPIDQTVEFGALKVTPRVCNTRPPTEAPKTTGFVEVDEVKLTGEVQRIFTGWMFAESPGLHAVEHPVFDVWLTSCKTSAPVNPAGNAENAPSAEEAPPAPPTEAAPPENAPMEPPPLPNARSNNR